MNVGQPGGFSDLLEKAERLSSGIKPAEGKANLFTPKSDLSLNQVFAAGERLWQKTVAASGSSAFEPNENASILFRTKAAAVPRLPERLQTTVLGKLAESSEPAAEGPSKPETDLETFLRNEEETALVSLIEETISSTVDNIQQRHWELVAADWDQQKQKLFNTIPNVPIAERTKRQAISSYFDQSVSQRRTPMSEVEVSFAQTVCAFTEKVLYGGLRPKLADLFVGVAENTRQTAFVTLWQQVRQMIELPIQAGKDIISQRSSPRFAVQCCGQALKFLEHQFQEYMQSVVHGNLAVAKLGGEPGLLKLIIAYLNVKLQMPYVGSEDGFVENHPVWAVIYACLRAGDARAALQAAKNAGPQLAEFASVLTELLSTSSGGVERLSPETETKLRLIYQRSVRKSADPFKRVVYSVLAGCDVNTEHPDVCDKLEDWLWVRLRQARLSELAAEASAVSGGSFSRSTSATAGGMMTDSTARSKPDSLRLAQLQKMVSEEFGEAHFCASDRDNPFLYFAALWITGQFELAVEFLCRQSEVLRCHAVHIALATYQMGLLLVPTEPQAKLISVQLADPPGMKRLNLVRLLMMYTAKFELTDLNEVLCYLHFLRDFVNQKGENLFLSSVSDLVLRTKEPGLIDKFHAPGNVQRLIEFVATESEAKGLHEAAVILYDLAGKHSKALEILCNLLSNVVSQPSAAGSTRERLAKLAYDIASRYKKHGHSASADISSVFFLLMDLHTFFDCYYAQRFVEAFDIIRKLRVLPLRLEDVDSFINNFHMVAEQHRVVLASLLLAVMQILFELCKEIKATSKSSLAKSMVSPASTLSKESLKDYRDAAQAILLYAGRVPHRLPADTNARLIQLESLMSTEYSM